MGSRTSGLQNPNIRVGSNKKRRGSDKDMKKLMKQRGQVTENSQQMTND